MISLRRLLQASAFIFLALACRTSDLIDGTAPAPDVAAPAPVRPTFTPAQTVAAKSAPTATRPRAQATRPATAPPTFTLAPPPTQPPAPPPTPAGPFYKITGKSCGQGGDTRIIGTVYENGVKANGVRMRVSAVSEGPPAINDFYTGVDPNDPKRRDDALQGQYRLALYEGQRKAGNWFVFILNRLGEVQSEIGNVQTTDGPGCNIATIDFAH